MAWIGYLEVIKIFSCLEVFYETKQALRSIRDEVVLEVDLECISRVEASTSSFVPIQNNIILDF